MTTLVAVYGSLLKGLHNHRVLGDSEFVGKTSVNMGQMVSMGRYPAVVAAKGDKPTPIECYNVTREVLVDLDRLEGHPHLYCREPIETEFGKAWVYILPWRDDMHRLELVPNNDWRTYVEAARSVA